MEKKVEIISQDLIKPEVSQTSCHPKFHNFSALDQLAPPAHVPVFLYYPPRYNDQEASSHHFSAKSQLLKTSLSKILCVFYPFAGRINEDNRSIRCNDDGILFIEAFAHNCKLKDDILLSNQKELTSKDILGPFLPLKYPTDHLLIVQVTFFECGGMILGYWVSHKLCDATSVCTFINSWAAMTTALADGPNSTVYPNIPDLTTGTKMFPPLAKQPPPLPFTGIVQETTTITKIYIFDASSIRDLKSKALSQGVSSPTRVEAVTALIWKCATSSPSNLTHVVNCRKRVVPSLPNETIGNFLAFAVATKGEHAKELPELVAILKKGLSAFPDLTCDGALGPILENWKMFGEVLSRSSNVEHYHFVGWCGIPFYGADFGWKKPAWVSTMELHHKNTVVLVDTSDGGIEAWVCLDVNHMAEFEKNTDLLTFATIKHWP